MKRFFKQGEVLATRIVTTPIFKNETKFQMCEECQIIAWATFLSRLTRSSVVGNEWKKLFAWEISILFLGHSSAFRFGTCNIHFQLLKAIHFEFLCFQHSSSKVKKPFHHAFMLLPLDMWENTTTNLKQAPHQLKCILWFIYKLHCFWLKLLIAP